MPSPERKQFSLLGGSLCLDFVNTVAWRLRENPSELIDSYRDLIDWSLQAEILTEGQASSLRRESEDAPVAAAAALTRATELRELLFRVFFACAKGEEVGSGDLEALNALIRGAMSQARLVRTGSGFAWDWSDPGALDGLLRPVIRSAADLLTSPELKRVKVCSDPGCGWLFVDRSKNGRRSWCSMQDCGNRAKARRFYKRHRPARSAGKAGTM